MDLRNFGKVLVVTVSATAVAALTACGSDNNAGTSSGGEAAGTVACGGKKSLKGSGATAQANAMTRFVTAYEAACAGFTLNYLQWVRCGGVRVRRRSDRYWRQ